MFWDYKLIRCSAATARTTFLWPRHRLSSSEMSYRRRGRDSVVSATDYVIMETPHTSV